MGIIENQGDWTSRKRILVILAHPDDPEFFCGASIARWCSLGHDVHYCLITKGQRGSQDVNTAIEEIERTRVTEQNNAARLLGVSGVKFLEYFDGDLLPDLKLREDIVREIRINKPDILVTSDPQNLFPADNRINHPDHRAAGQAVIDAVFPNAGNPRVLVKDADHKLIPPHQVEEVWVTLTHRHNITIDVSDYFDTKMNAIACHQSQLYESIDQLKEKFRARWELDPDTGLTKYYERFKRIQLIAK